MPTSPGDATPIDGEKVEIKGELGGDGVRAEDVKEEVKQDLEDAGVDNPQVCLEFMGLWLRCAYFLLWSLGGLILVYRLLWEGDEEITVLCG